MPRALVLGNGEMLVSFDGHGLVRDFYFPYVGSENHMTGCFHRIGIWVDGVFTWLGDTGWDITVDYEDNTMVSSIRAAHNGLSIEVVFTDVVYNEQNIFIRKLAVKNNTPRQREFRVFFNQEFQISGISHGNTAYYDPDTKSIIHYYGPRVFMVSGESEKRSFSDFSVGVSHIEGKEGTWKDAEDGALSKNAVEHGSVDSTVAFSKKIEGDETHMFYYWVISAESLPVAKGLREYILLHTVEHLIQTTRDYWHAWIGKLDVDFQDLPGDLVKLFKRSLLIMRTHVDNRGAIIASCDADILQFGRDTYSYMWPRDGAVTAIALDRAGFFEATTPFFLFANEVLSQEGYLLHKYRPDKSPGSSWHPWFFNGKKQLAIQEDETALVLYALWRHYEMHKDLEFVEKIYNSFIKRVADFLYFYRDEKTGLPYGSYDIWEEKFGTSTFTASAVYGALVAAANFSHVLGKKDEAKKYQQGADEVKKGILSYLYNKEEKFFYKLIDMRESPHKYDRTHDASSFYGPFRFGVLSAGDEKLEEGFLALQAGPCCVLHEGTVGGVIRYEHDMYRLTHKEVPGNPWVITTMWVYQYEIARAKTKKELEQVRARIEWVASRALSSGILSEQFDPYTGEQLSVAPLTWSHAEYVHTILNYLERLKELKAS